MDLWSQKGERGK